MALTNLHVGMKYSRPSCRRMLVHVGRCSNSTVVPVLSLYEALGGANIAARGGSGPNWDVLDPHTAPITLHLQHLQLGVEPGSSDPLAATLPNALQSGGA